MTITHLHATIAINGLQQIVPLDPEGLVISEERDGAANIARSKVPGSNVSVREKFSDILERMTAAGLVLQLGSTAPIKACDHFWQQHDREGTMISCRWCGQIRPNGEADFFRDIPLSVDVPINHQLRDNNQKLREANEALRRTIRQQDGELSEGKAAIQIIDNVEDFIRRCGDPELQEAASSNAPLLLVISRVVQVALARGFAATAERKHNQALSKRLDELDAKHAALQLHESGAVRMLRDTRGALQTIVQTVAATDATQATADAWGLLRTVIDGLDSFLALKAAPEADKPE